MGREDLTLTREELAAEGTATRESMRTGESEFREVDLRLRSYARKRSALDAAETFDLVRAERMRIWMYFGYVSLFEYMERVLGYEPHTARERMRVARALGSLPVTTAELARGALTYSAVRELTRVAIPETEAVWLEVAADRTAHQIASLVAGHAPGDLPEDPTRPELRARVVRIELPTEVLALLRQARSVIAGDRGASVSDAELIETMCRQILDPTNGKDGPAHQIAYKQCPDCKRATQNGAGRELDVRTDVIERAACDARIIGDLDAAVPERATSTVTPRMREQVFARDAHRCTVPGCRSALNLDVHHIIEQGHGGPNRLWNLTLTCSGHHFAVHAGLMSMIGRAPDQLRCTWKWRPPSSVDIDAAVVDDLLAEDLMLDDPSGRVVPREQLPRRASSFADAPEPRAPRRTRLTYEERHPRHARRG